MSVLDTICSLARSNRTARIFYQKLTDKVPTARVIEPYHLLEQNSAMMLMSWQVDPTVNDPCWRTFRVDRIKDVSDGGSEYTPRRQVSIADGEIKHFMDVCARRERDPVEKYRRYLLKAVADSHLDDAESKAAIARADELDQRDLKVVHSQVYVAVLMDMLLDHTISIEEDHFLCELRSFMDKVGWAP